MMRFSIYIVIILVFIGCSKEQTVKTGTYSSYKISRIELFYLYLTKGVNAYSVGSKIYLAPDSIFTYQSCGNIMTGTWTASNDTIFLKVMHNRWRSDSLNTHGFEDKWPLIPEKPLEYILDDDCLIHIWPRSNGKKTIEMLRYAGASNMINHC